MRIKLLKRLRNEARDRVFLIPISGDIDRCVIEEDMFDPDAADLEKIQRENQNIVSEACSLKDSKYRVFFYILLYIRNNHL